MSRAVALISTVLALILTSIAGAAPASAGPTGFPETLSIQWGSPACLNDQGFQKVTFTNGADASYSLKIIQYEIESGETYYEGPSVALQPGEVESVTLPAPPGSSTWSVSGTMAGDITTYSQEVWVDGPQCATPSQFPLAVTFTSEGALAHVGNPSQLTFNDCVVYEDRNDAPITLATVSSIQPGYQGAFETMRPYEDAVIVYVQCTDENFGRRYTVGSGIYVFGTAVDSDNDGVTDDLDQCPGTPAGQTVTANGCAASLLDSSGRCNAKKSVIAALEAKIGKRESEGLPTQGLTNALFQQRQQLQKFGCD